MYRPVHILKTIITLFLLVSLCLITLDVSIAELTLNPDSNETILLENLHIERTSNSSEHDTLTKKLITKYPPLPGQHILGIGEGLSRNAFYLAKEFHVSVVAIGIAEAIREQLHESEDSFDLPVRFLNKKSTEVSFSNESFDAVFSSGELIYLENKQSFLNRAYNWLKPGGKLLFTTFCLDTEPLQDTAKVQFQQRNYFPNSIKELKTLLRMTGFESVTALNKETEILKLLKSSLQQLRQQKNEFLSRNSEANYKALVEGWKGDIERIKKQQQTWTIFQAVKPGAGPLSKIYAQGINTSGTLN